MLFLYNFTTKAGAKLHFCFSDCPEEVIGTLPVMLPIGLKTYTGTLKCKFKGYILLLLLRLLHPFNGLFSRTTWVSRHQKDRPVWILMEQEMMGWHWHQLDHMHLTPDR